MGLCECIEDCEYPQIIVRILHILADFGPTAVAPSRFIRFIFNRVILEGAAVRAAAVQALGVFAGRVEAVRESVVELLRGCLVDESDEVRDRAVVALEALQADPRQRDALLFRGVAMTPGQLRLSLQTYKLRPAEGPLDYSHLPAVAEPVRAIGSSSGVAVSASAGMGMGMDEEGDLDSGVSVGVGAGSGTSALSAQAQAQAMASELYQIPAFADYGAIIRSGTPTMLTEEETEYVVSVVRHVFASHVVLQFLVKNTIEGQVMTDVLMQLSIEEGDASEWEPVAQLAAPVIAYGEQKACYVALAFAEGCIPEATFKATLHFEAKDVEEDEMDQLDDIEGYHEEYPVEVFTVQMADYIARPVLADFRGMWNDLGSEGEAVEKVTLPFEDLPTAVKGIVDVLGLYAFEGSDRVNIGVGDE